MISQKSKYATLILVYMANRASEDNPVRLRDCCKYAKCSLSYGEQLMHGLRKTGIAIGIKGPLGGYYLKKPPQDITFSQVCRVVENGIRKPHNPLLDRLTSKVYSHLAHITLADIIALDGKGK